jgi:hypothetical protein
MKSSSLPPGRMRQGISTQGHLAKPGAIEGGETFWEAKPVEQ